MSSLHKLKAYFGMVPVDDGYYTDADYDTADGSGYDEQPARREPRQGGAVRVAGAEPAGRETGYPGAVHEAAGYDQGHLEQRSGSRLEALGARGGGRRPVQTTTTRGALAVEPELQVQPAEPRTQPSGEDGYPLGTITTLHPRTYNEARTIGERFREGSPVIMNLTEMSDADAKRLVDFAAGLAFAMRGAIDKITNKVFLLSPSDVDVTAEDKRRIVENGFYNHS